MTPEEFLEECKRLIDNEFGDHECVHGETDKLMETLLTELGYGEGIKLIVESTRWYA